MMANQTGRQLLRALLAALIGLLYGAVIGAAIPFIVVSVFKYGIANQPQQQDNALLSLLAVFKIFANALMVVVLPFLGAIYGALTGAVICGVAVVVNRDSRISLLIGAAGGGLLSLMAWLNTTTNDPLRLCSLIAIPFFALLAWLVTALLSKFLLKTEAAGQRD